MIRAVVLFEYGSLNGGEHSFLSAIPALRSHQIQLTAVAPTQGELAQQLRESSTAVEPLDWHGRRGRRCSQAELRQRLASLLGRLAPKLVHANSLSMSRLAGPVVRDLGLPGLGHLRDIVGLSAQVLADLNCWPRLLAVSRATRDWHVTAGLEASRVAVQYNGVDLQRFRPCRPSRWLHDELGLPPTCPLVGTIGQIGLRKGTDLVLDTAALLAQDATDLHWVVVGQRSSRKAEAVAFEQSLHQRAGQPPLRGRVHFLGYRHDLPELLPELTIVLHAARQEPLGRVLLEAAAAGCPIVATRVGGTAEIFPSTSQAAVVVPRCEAPLLAAAAGRLLADEAARRVLARAARQRAEQAFDARHRGEELAKHYHSVAGVAWQQHAAPTSLPQMD